MRHQGLVPGRADGGGTTPVAHPNAAARAAVFRPADRSW